MQRYLFIFGMTVLVALAATAGLAWLVNPYAYWDTPVIDGINRFHPASGKHLRAVKLRQYERLQPTTLVAGNSRVDVGIDPASKAWPAVMRPVYNLGLPGTATDAVIDAAIAAVRIHPPQSIWLGVEFADFPQERPDARPDLTQPLEQLSLAARILLSLDALEDSLSALAEQHKSFPATITPAGYNGLGEYNAIVAAEGHAALFAQRAAEGMKTYRERGPALVRIGAQHPSFRSLDRLAKEARQRRIPLAVFTYPYHVNLLLAFRRAGLWPAYESWIRGLADFSERTGVPVYVFTVLNDMTTEPVPRLGDRKTHMRWYWEAGHFKSALGDKMIASIFSGGRHGRLGFRLTRAAAGVYLARLKVGLDAYADGHPRAVEHIDRAYAQAAASAHG
jgi:hypothetical protein